jgi:hypothetical protein
LAYLAGDAAARPAYVHNLARNLALFDAVRPILDAAPVLPLKGLCLANTVYSDAAARSMSDLDLAVLPRDLDATMRILSDLGWRRMFGRRARYSPRHGHDVAFTDDSGHVLELHYKLFHEMAIDADLEPLFARAIEVELLGKRRRVPSWDDHLFVVAVHAATHAFGESASWLIDVALLLPQASVENAHLEAARRGAGPAFRSALRTAHRALRQIAAPSGDLVREKLLDVILPDRFAVPTQIRSLLARAALTEKPYDAVREVVRKLGLRLEELREPRS